MSSLPVFGAFLEATGAILVKKIINKKNIDFKNYIVYIFLTIVLVSLPLLFFFWKVDQQALKLTNLAIFAIIIIVSIFANFFIFYSLKREDLSEIQPIRLTTPLFTILIVFILSFFFEIYANERNYSILFLALIASIALIITHIKKDHIAFTKYSLAAIIGSFLFAIEMTLSKPILFFYNPLTFYFIRSLWIFIITWTIFHPKLSPLETKTKIMIFLTAITAVMFRVILYYGFQTIGVIFTTTIFILAPVLTYIFAAIFLKERITKKQIISSIVVVACVIGAIVIGS